MLKTIKMQKETFVKKIIIKNTNKQKSNAIEL